MGLSEGYTTEYLDEMLRGSRKLSCWVCVRIWCVSYRYTSGVLYCTRLGLHDAHKSSF